MLTYIHTCQGLPCCRCQKTGASYAVLRDSWALPRAGGSCSQEELDGIGTSSNTPRLQALITRLNSFETGNMGHMRKDTGQWLWQLLSATLVECFVYCYSFMIVDAGSRSVNAFLDTLHRRVSTKWWRWRKVEEDNPTWDRLSVGGVVIFGIFSRT